MSKIRYIQLLGLALGVALVNIILFSPGLAGLRFGADALTSALVVTVLCADVLAIGYGSYSLFFSAPKAVPVRELQGPEDYREALRPYRRYAPLEEEVGQALGQIDRFHKKVGTLIELLGQRFEPGELSYRKFASVAGEAEKLFYLNGRSMLNRLHVFDEAEYESVRKPKQGYTGKVLEERAALYRDHLSYIQAVLAGNEELMLKLDKLLLELSRLDSLEAGDIERMPGMRELDELIRQTPYYKNE